MTWTPHITVATVIERHGRYLMVYERVETGREVYNQPAGHVEAGETLIAAAIRETREETAWEVEIQSLIGVYVYTPPAAEAMTYYRFCFAARALHELDQPLDAGILRAEWLSYADIIASTQLRSPMVRRCIDDHRAGRQHPLDLLCDPVVNA